MICVSYYRFTFSYEFNKFIYICLVGYFLYVKKINGSKDIILNAGAIALNLYGLILT